MRYISELRERIARGGDPQSSLSHQLNLLFKTARKVKRKTRKDIFESLSRFPSTCIVFFILSRLILEAILSLSHKEIVCMLVFDRCGHCKTLAPEYEKATTILSKHEPPVILAKVDAYEEANKELASKYEVGVFPEFSGKEYENFMDVAEKLRSDYDFGHTSDAKFLPHGDSTVKHPKVRLFKPFDELLVDIQNFQVDALESFIEVSSVPVPLTKN
ncbi:hypothetical protein J5N97_012291 [Dioscorea zingiberensis]|uniref:protein disulfide-isomerase n=1 Tax=Dioscorea zingiberensis TaxID=325984 RepID=A0A9D5HHY5_9LILI|nr:hypothetical protein J5N97_012291 [Dioscorea zingiberensis]